MIPYTRDPQQTISSSAVKIVGLGGAGANMLERIALDGMEGAELLALNTDVRTLAACLAREKIQLGVSLTKGLGAGGDPELGHQAVLESEEQVRASIKGRRIVFLCTGLGGGTGSGAAPIVTRIAREEGAFVVVFATMPFAFEGKRRREQAETALNELAVLSNALVTFDNNRMGELVLAKQGIHEAFAAADHMICESIKAVIRLVVRPGLINVGLDDLMSALRTNRSRCLFGSGIAEGKDRASKALKNALNSPLLDQGSLLKDAQTVLVHLSGGEDLTLFEIELLMQRLGKFVPDKAHVLFGAAIDPAMGNSLSITLISALPEDCLALAPRDSLSQRSQENPILEPSQGFTSPPKRAIFTADKAPDPEPETKVEPESKSAPPPAPLAPPAPSAVSPLSKFRQAATSVAADVAPSLFDNDRPFAEPDYAAKTKTEPVPKLEAAMDGFTFAKEVSPDPSAEAIPLAAEPESLVPAEAEEVEVMDLYTQSDVPDPAPIEDDTFDDVIDIGDPEEVPQAHDHQEIAVESAEAQSKTVLAKASGFTLISKKRPSIVSPWGKRKPLEFQDDIPEEAPAAAVEEPPVTAIPEEVLPEPVPAPVPASEPDPELPKLKLGIKGSGSQSELSLDSTPRGRFEGETPNVFNGEDLDLPPFLRKKR
jgi:cell division protein FtsZ